LKRRGTTLLGSGTPAGATGQADGADGWWGMATSSPGARLALHLPLLTKGIGKGRSSG
jgi:hypothetical protein